MKTKIQYLKILEYYIRNKKKNQKCRLSEKFVHLCTQYLAAQITASVCRGIEAISPRHCWGAMEAQVALIAAFSSSVLLGLVSLIFPLIILAWPLDRYGWPIKHSNNMVRKPVTSLAGKGNPYCIEILILILLVGTLHVSHCHQCMYVCMIYCKLLWAEVSAICHKCKCKPMWPFLHLHSKYEANSSIRLV